MEPADVEEVCRGALGPAGRQRLGYAGFPTAWFSKHKDRFFLIRQDGADV